MRLEQTLSHFSLSIARARLPEINLPINFLLILISKQLNVTRAEMRARARLGDSSGESAADRRYMIPRAVIRSRLPQVSARNLLDARRV